MTRSSSTQRCRLIQSQRKGEREKNETRQTIDEKLEADEYDDDDDDGQYSKWLTYVCI